ncbi:MAG: glutaredoxin family protein [Actinomycetota bacterium]|nr:glutaredoxin family protein [Actinomycetota bacterium]
MPRRRVVLYHAEGCHLCARARAQVAALREELGFELEEIDIGGDPELEARYREWLPVVEIDGVRAFVYYVQPDALRRKLVAQKSRPGGRLVTVCRMAEGGTGRIARHCHKHRHKE